MSTPIPANTASFAAADVLAATGGSAFGSTWAAVQGVVTDSRAVAQGNLYIALRGDRFDGHRFAGDAVRAGATAVVVEAQSEGTRGVVVDDTLVALGQLATAHRVTWGGRVVGITGSAGKTTTKELVAAVLADAGQRVHATVGNLNNRIGVPMTLFQLTDQVDTAVVEMGTSLPGEIRSLARIARPDVGVVTLVAAAHTEGLGSLEAVAEEKVSLLSAVAEDGVVVGFGDDPAIAAAVSSAQAKTKRLFGFSEHNHVRLTDWRPSVAGNNCDFIVCGQPLVVRTKLVGRGPALCVGAALGTASALGLDVIAAAKAMAHVEPPAGRMSIRRLGGLQVIDDTYNANPASMAAAIETAARMARAEDRPFSVALGDMGELGELTEHSHEQVGAQLADAGVSYALLVGDAMQAALVSAGSRGVQCDWARDVDDVTDASLERVADADVVLVKGSRAMTMERIAERIAALESAL